MQIATTLTESALWLEITGMAKDQTSNLRSWFLIKPFFMKKRKFHPFKMNKGNMAHGLAAQNTF